MSGGLCLFLQSGFDSVRFVFFSQNANAEVVPRLIGRECVPEFGRFFGAIVADSDHRIFLSGPDNGRRDERGDNSKSAEAGNLRAEVGNCRGRTGKVRLVGIGGRASIGKLARQAHNLRS